MPYHYVTPDNILFIYCLLHLTYKHLIFVFNLTLYLLFGTKIILYAIICIWGLGKTWDVCEYFPFKDLFTFLFLGVCGLTVDNYIALKPYAVARIQ